MLKESKLRLLSTLKILADSGYRGMQKLHTNFQLPHRKTKKKPLTKEQKKENQHLASQRIGVENTIGLLKRFKIITNRYRNRRKCFSLRFNLIAAIHNMELIN